MEQQYTLHIVSEFQGKTEFKKVNDLLNNIIATTFRSWVRMK